MQITSCRLRGILLFALFLALSKSEQFQVGAQSGPAPTLNAAVMSEAGFDAIRRGSRPRGYGVLTYTLSEPAEGRFSYVVATTGSDNNPGTSAAPFRTINKAAQVAAAGDVVTIKDGTFQESVFVRNSGTVTRPIVFQAENRGGVVLTGGQYTFQPTGWTGGKMTSGPLYVTVRGLKFHQYASNAVGAAALRAATGWRIVDCWFTYPGRNGLDMRGDDIELTQSSLDHAYSHAFVAWGPANKAASPTDPKFVGIVGLRVTDSILQGNYLPQPAVDGAHASSVAKVLGTRGALFDNLESYENNGPGLWLDGSNYDYVVRNSYFHDNKYLGTGYSPGRGLHLELSWGPALVESNVFANNSHEGLAINNSSGVTVRNNLFVGNLRQIVVSNWDRGAAFVLKDIRMEYNRFLDWRQFAAIEPLGNITADALPSMNITADYNVYQPSRSNWLSGWWGQVIGAITSIDEMRRRLGWERNGQIGVPQLPAQRREDAACH